MAFFLESFVCISLNLRLQSGIGQDLLSDIQVWKSDLFPHLVVDPAHTLCLVRQLDIGNNHD